MNPATATNKATTRQPSEHQQKKAGLTQIYSEEGPDVLERASQWNGWVALGASILTALLLLTAVGLAVWDPSLHGPVVALIAAGVFAGIAMVNAWSGARAIQQLATRRYQAEMLTRVNDLDMAAQAPKAEGWNSSPLTQLMSQSVESMKHPPEKGDGSDCRVVSDWLDSMSQLWKEADDNHARLMSERLELMKAIVTPVERTGK